MTDSNAPKAPFHDPNAEAEAQKYENPVASRDALLALLEQLGHPATHAEVCEALGETDEDRVEALRRRLIAMSRDGQLISNRRSQFAPLRKVDLVTGVVMGHRDGYGFVLRDGADDVYLSNRQMSKVFHGDRVAVQILGLDRRGRPEGKIVEVLERNTQQIVGRYFDQSGVGVVQPDNKRVAQEILIPPVGRKGAEHGQFVVVQIVEQPKPGGLPMGEVVEVLGDHLAPGMEIDVAIRSHNIPHEWPDAVLVEAKKLPEQVKDKDKHNRIDLRQLPFVTIDGEDAKDFDDAVYCEPNRKTGGWRLYVAIADVSHYVQAGSALDVEAHGRGNSVYFPEFVVPMLPEKLSNGLCSLNPEVDRLVMVCEMTISKAGNISGYQFMEGVIHSHARLTYNKVWKMLQPERGDDGDAWREHYKDVVPHLENLYALYKTLRAKREERGAMDFDSVETRIVFDAERKIQEIVPTERNAAHMLIEECMLAANVCAADFFQRYDVPALYRVHNGPSAEKLENLKSFLAEVGLSMPHGQDPSPKDYQALLSQIGDRPDSHLIQTVLLRSLSQAVYKPDNEGHFGLAYKAYTHFTSPIRRYPDLLVHRGLRSVIRSERECKHVKRADGAKPLAQKTIYPYDTAAMVVMGEHCSMTERRADDATRDVVDFLKCEFISDRIGEEFEGVITAVTGFGLFVELKDVYVEGLVHISGLANDYYHFDAVKHRLVGERTRRSFRLGDKLWVRVMNVNLDERKVDFELTTAPVNARRSKASDLPTPARLPRRRNKQADGKVTEEMLEPSRQKKARAPSTESGDGARSGGNKSGANKSGVKNAGVKRTADKGAKTFAADDSDGTKSKKKKPKPSKRQKLNAKKKTESKKAVKKKTAKKKPAKKAGKKTG
ncbi:ribonuclease R [Thalassolituus sp. UBA2009]|uniref:ribonuclease R n=1 Tax=Thalassolituus sp. UBA2009 TaxID=1947658 RepID=UPI00257D3507|nr:ribonuclease R [Thalassolituus sp. UBA2009]